MGMQVALLYLGLHFFKYMPRSIIIRLHIRSIFRFLRKLRNTSHGGCPNLHCQQEWIDVPFPLHPHQQLVFMLLLTAILTVVT
jgi:hypothetical protein